MPAHVLSLHAAAPRHARTMLLPAPGLLPAGPGPAHTSVPAAGRRHQSCTQPAGHTPAASHASHFNHPTCMIREQHELARLLTMQFHRGKSLPPGMTASGASSPQDGRRWC
jgi:hypothetical protein